MSTIILSHQSINWVNILNPTQADIQALSEQHPLFHSLNLKDCLTELEYPKLDHYDHYLFLVAQMPYRDPHDGRLQPAEVDIFITEDVLVTAHRGELEAIQRMFASAQSSDQNREEWMASGTSTLLYHLLDALVNDCYPIVTQVGHALRTLEDNLFENRTRVLLYEIASLRRDIIVMGSILNSQRDILNGLIKGDWEFIHQHLDPYWEDISSHLSQLCSLADQYAQVVDGLSDTTDTLASHRIDEVVRLLTITTVLTLPVTLLAAVFGMNVLMPYANHPLLFYSVILISIAATIGLVWYLRKKRWL
jgi:magnesium transporter